MSLTTPNQTFRRETKRGRERERDGWREREINRHTIIAIWAFIVVHTFANISIILREKIHVTPSFLISTCKLFIDSTEKKKFVS